MVFEITIEMVFLMFLMIINLILCYKTIPLINLIFGLFGVISGLLIYTSGMIPTIDSIDLIIFLLNTVLCLITMLKMIRGFNPLGHD